MPVSRKFDSATGRITIKAEGEIKLTDLRLAYEALLADPQFIPGSNILWDLTSANTVMPSDSEADDSYTWSELTTPLRGVDFKSAFVVYKSQEYGIARVFSMYLENMPGNVEIFSDLKEAIAWLEK